jgi:ABC-type antimicrobial peptide transport system permease subunit
VALMAGFLANIYFEQRLSEFGLLSAFGFRRERLARRVIVETGSLVVVSWLFGLALTWLLFQLFDKYYMEPQGLVLAHLNVLALQYTLPTPIIVGIASLATVLLRLYRTDPIEIMERR